jgi:hypothetical protein
MATFAQDGGLAAPEIEDAVLSLIRFRRRFRSPWLSGHPKRPLRRGRALLSGYYGYIIELGNTGKIRPAERRYPA